MKFSIGIFYIALASIVEITRSFPSPQVEEPINEEMIDLEAFGTMLFSEPDESVGKSVQNWLPEHDQNPEELGTYVEGDMLVPTVEGRNGLVKESTRWPNGIVPFVFASNVGSADRNIIHR